VVESPLAYTEDGSRQADRPGREGSPNARYVWTAGPPTPIPAILRMPLKKEGNSLDEDEHLVAVSSIARNDDASGRVE
jgi:hypothetical protein